MMTVIPGASQYVPDDVAEEKGGWVEIVLRR